MKQLFFSFEGRIGRKTYWLSVLGLVGVLVVAQLLMVGLAAVSETLGLIGAILALAICAVALIPSFALPIKRWHDLDKSGWYVLLGFIPVVNLYALVMLGFVRGTEGSNQYGDDPLRDGDMRLARAA